MLFQHPCSERVCLQEGKGWGNQLGRPTLARVLLVRRWVGPRLGKVEFCGCSRAASRCHAHGVAIFCLRGLGKQFFQPILLA